MQIRQAFIFCCTWFVACVHNVDPSKTNLNLEELKSFVNHVMQCRKIVGLGLTLVYKNEVVFAGGFGEADMDKHTPVDRNSKFAIGSLTKAFTSVVVAKVLSEQRR